MAKRFIITPVNEDGTVGRAIYIHKKGASDKVSDAIVSIGNFLVGGFLLCVALLLLWRYTEVYW